MPTMPEGTWLFVDHFVPFHTCGSQLLKFYVLIKTLKYGRSFKRSLFSVNKRLITFPVLSQYY